MQEIRLKLGGSAADMIIIEEPFQPRAAGVAEARRGEPGDAALAGG